MVRCAYLTKRLAITDLKLDVPRLVKKKELTAAFESVFHPWPSSLTWTFCHRH
jgi:hypothetical protein